MDIIKIVNESFSVSDVSVKIFGYANGRTINKTLLLLEQNGLDKSIFEGKNKNRKHEKIKRECPICFIEFETVNGEKGKITCSSSCANSYFQHGKNNPDFNKDKYKKRYEKVSNKLKELIPWNKGINGGEKIKICLNCKKEFISNRYKQIYCSKICISTSDIYRKKLSDAINKRIENGIHKGWQSRNIESYPETFFKKVLENNGIIYEFNKTINKKDLGINNVGNYFLDFYIKEGNIDLEIDGNQHKYRQEHDELRDKNLSNKFNIYRIKWKSINSENGKKYIKEEIDKLLNYIKTKNDETI